MMDDLKDYKSIRPLRNKTTLLEIFAKEEKEIDALKC
jgi:hypothetical protein